MIYLSGAVRTELAGDERLGVMATYKMGNVIPADSWWAVDNGCFPTGDFDARKHEAHLRRNVERLGTERLLFVVVPDQPFDGDGTIAKFHEWRDRFAALGHPLAFVTQDGMGAEDVPWGAIQSVFVGGSTEWKTGHESAALITEARRRGKWVHMGRVNSLRRLRVAASMGCNSVDGTFLKYAPDINRPRLLRWLELFDREPVMAMETVA